SLLSDFGHRDPYTGIVKGVVLRHHPTATLIDLCHEVPPQDVSLAGFYLQAAVHRFPKGTIHVAVVDPGVGSQRRILALCAHDDYWLAPDNGILTGLLTAGDMELRCVNLKDLGLTATSQTFHGRDLFAPLAG